MQVLRHAIVYSKPNDSKMQCNLLHIIFPYISQNKKNKMYLIAIYKFYICSTVYSSKVPPPAHITFIENKAFLLYIKYVHVLKPQNYNNFFIIYFLEFY